MRNVFKIILALSSFNLAHADCPDAHFTYPDKVSIQSDSVLIVTHPTTDFDGGMIAKDGIDEAVAYAKKNSIPVIYLYHLGYAYHRGDLRINTDTFYLNDCHPDYWIYSTDGYFELPPALYKQIKKFYLVGGYWLRCFNNTQSEVINNLIDQSKNGFHASIIKPLNAIYHENGYNLEELRMRDPSSQTVFLKNSVTKYKSVQVKVFFENELQFESEKRSSALNSIDEIYLKKLQ